MKTEGLKKLCCVILGVALTVSVADAQTPAGKETTVESDSFRLDLEKQTGVFLGGVHVVDAEFELTADEMTLFFDKGNKIERMSARGNVVIKQGEKQTATGHEADYEVAGKKLRLTGNPQVQQGGNKVTGKVIYLYPGSDRMEVEGRSKVRFYQQ
ncbi:MAG: lipopolysaccharide transport periplasmic protein LptA [Verrucomicrobiales bacterium]|jgi:lipopolysaccharide transport protein LptA|nr:lipopolysaccharide transport periplasmic protein LptA [Verrucomicrobiales bacterium]